MVYRQSILVLAFPYAILFYFRCFLPFQFGRGAKPPSRSLSAADPSKKHSQVTSLPEGIGKVNQLYVTPDGKDLYIVGGSNRALWRIDVSTPGKFPRRQLLFAQSNLPKAESEKATIVDSVPDVFVAVWKETSGPRMILLCRTKIVRFSPDLSSATIFPLGPLEEFRKRMDPTVTSSGRVFFRGQDGWLNEILVSESAVQISRFCELPKMKFQDESYDVTVDGSVYMNGPWVVLHRAPGATEFLPLIGTGAEPPFRDGPPQRLSGPPLTANLGSFPTMRGDANGNLLFIHSTVRGGPHPYSLLHQYYQKEHNRFVTIAFAGELLDRSNWVPPWARSTAFDAERSRYFVGLEEDKAIYCVEFDIPPPVLAPTKLSALWENFPELSDVLLPLPDGSSRKLHSNILALRCPELLATPLQLSQEHFEYVLRYIYDDVLPPELEISPTVWPVLWQAAQDLSLPSLASRCVTAFHRALYTASPAICLSATLSVASTDIQEFIDVAQYVLFCRPALLTAEVIETLRQFPSILAWLVLKQSALIQERIHGYVHQGSYWSPPAADPPAHYAGADMLKLLPGQDESLTSKCKPDMSLFGVPCHRSVMQARCPFVANWFAMAPNETNIPALDDDISSDIVACIVQFLYSLRADDHTLGRDASRCEKILQLSQDVLQIGEFVTLFDYCKRIVEENKQARENPFGTRQGPF